MIEPDFLRILRCPATRQTLTVASAEVLARINRERPAKILEALLRADGTVAYPVQDGIPILLVEAAIPV